MQVNNNQNKVPDPSAKANNQTADPATQATNQTADPATQASNQTADPATQATNQTADPATQATNQTADPATLLDGPFGEMLNAATSREEMVEMEKLFGERWKLTWMSQLQTGQTIPAMQTI